MNQFLEDVGNRKAFVAGLVALVGAALALGLAVPFGFATLTEKLPSLSSFLSVEANELGINVIYVPAGMLAVTSFCLILEAFLLGYEKSTVKRIIANDTPSVRTDVFYLLFRVSGLLMVFCLIFSFGSLYVGTGYIKSEYNFAFMAHIDSIALQFLALVVAFSFVMYWVHRLVHTKYLWEVHKVHHSAEFYNVLLAYRVHPVEYIAGSLYGIAIVSILGVKPEAMMLWLGANAVYQSMVHSNYDWEWKWLEYIFITPAAHRIHHSTDPVHFNANLAILSIWDRMFGTYIAPKGETINLGVPDADRGNFNTDRFFTEMIACFWRWITLRSPDTGRAVTD